MSVLEYELGRHPGPPAQAARARRPDHAARPRRRLPCDREGDGRRALPDELLVDHPRVRGSRRGHLRRRGPGALRVRHDAAPHRLAAVVHPRLPPPASRSDRGWRRHRPQPPVPRRLAHARHRRCGADLLRWRADRVLGRDCARARRRRLVPGHQRGRVRSLRGVEALQRPALVPPRRAQRGARPHDLRQRPHRDHEPGRPERDAGRMPARAASDSCGSSALRRRHRDERRLRVDGLLGADAASGDREDPGRRVRRRPPGGWTTTPATATFPCASRRR